VLRALLALRFRRTQATNIAARIGQALAFAFGFIGLMGGNPLLIFIAIFVYLAATAEAQMVGLQDVSRNLGATDAMITKFESLGAQSTVADAARLLLATTQREFPVVDGAGKLRGFLTRNAMVEALSKSGPGTPVIEVMARNIPIVPRQARLDAVLKKMQEGAPAVGVIGPDEGLVGYITSENIGELLMVKDAGLGASGRGAFSEPIVTRQT
jgi:stage IV sporulation protein FB